MKTYFDIGEHVICFLETKKLGINVDLDAMPTFSVYDPDGTVLAAVDGEDMIENDTGMFQYDLATVGLVAGVYRAKARAVHAARITIIIGSFRLG